MPVLVLALALVPQTRACSSERRDLQDGTGQTPGMPCANDVECGGRVGNGGVPQDQGGGVDQKGKGKRCVWPFHAAKVWIQWVSKGAWAQGLICRSTQPVTPYLRTYLENGEREREGWGGGVCW